ncbi:NtaA/DmoA family FMN-dependent monooxygenase [Gordonia sp. ABSL1-1]|uniref:NtaA/DmoA family FMN-dependent monooxygenase n=1 Tax=Gordonia sp. ABSL1-1 TaxID=3053923 RepID=UPI002574200E|nr:NtaA/DmoA family FMN-dependent monooxygenase [Gordonia sp. ABSL1-1]MDL9938105.1 NtaA/DmoA family FMN-dependent monooxygenase [Gordonia sp. ABSL1-1]
MSTERYLHLNLVGNEINHHQGALAFERDHGGGPDRTANAYEPISEMGKLAEEGYFTAMFLGDIAGTAGSPAPDGGPPEPITAFAALARETTSLGLIATASTSFYDPYNLARLLASIDQISDGRAGFNAVTSVSDEWAQNYSLEQHLDRETRYRRCDEFLDVCTALWEKREIRDDADGIRRFYAEQINHRGDNFQVLGPLNVAPSPQGRPLIAQAGGSGPGIRVAAKHAEMVFTNANTREQAADYRKQLDAALIERGRAAGSVPAIPGLVPYLGATKEAAEEKVRLLDENVPYELYAPFALVQFGLEFTFDSIDDPFPLDQIPTPESVKDTIKSTYGNYVGLYTWISERPGVTVREVTAQSLARGGAQHRKFIGTYDDFVDDLAAWHSDGTVGGFNLMFPTGVIDIREFVAEVVPRLVDRGIYRGKSDTRPLRERFV